MHVLSRSIACAIIAWAAVGLITRARADCQMPPYPDSQTYAWYYNCVQNEAIQQRYEAQQQADQLNALQDEMRHQHLNVR